MSVEDTEIKLALIITAALVRKDANKLLDAVTQFMDLHSLSVTQARVEKIPVTKD